MKSKKVIEEHLNLANQFLSEGQHALARAHLYAVLELDGRSVAAHSGLLMSYAALLENKSALEHAHMWFLLEPTNPSARWAYGLMSFRLGFFDRAIVLLEPMTKTHPHWTNLHLVLAKIYLDRRLMSDSDPHFKLALKDAEQDPMEHAKVRWEYAMQLLTLGDFKQGWAHHEARLTSIGWQGLNLCPLPAPMWTGENLKGKTIVVHGEQGIGDEIMYASMIPDLLKRGAKVILACYPALVEVMTFSFPDIKVFAHMRGVDDIILYQQKQWPAWWNELKEQGIQVDFQIPMGSLAHILRNQTKDFPRVAYLKIDPACGHDVEHKLKAQAHEQGLDIEGKSLIALAWCGNLENPHGRAKSLNLEQLACLGKIAREHNAVFVGLQNRQYGYQAIEALTKKILPIIDMSAYTDAFSNTLALAGLCDHIITIDTSYAHLCGGAGLSTLMLLRRNCDWRWGWIRDDTVWYNSVEIIRQDVDGDWSTVIKKTEEKLLFWLTT